MRIIGPERPSRPAPLRVPPFVVILLIGVVSLAGCGGNGTSAGGTGSGSESQAPTLADSLVSSWIEAAGGMEAWRSVRSARYTVTTVWYDSAGAVERMRPRRVELRKTAEGEESRIERPEAEGLYVQVFSRDTAWATLNGHPLPPDHPAVREAEYVGRDVFYWFGLPYKLRDPGVTLEARQLPRGGHEVKVTFGSGVGAHPGDRYFYRFLDRDPFPEKVHYIEEGSDSRSRTVWSDFAEAGPITYVRTRRWLDEGGEPTKELRIDDVWINPPLADSLFRAPARGQGGGSHRGDAGSETGAADAPVEEPALARSGLSRVAFREPRSGRIGTCGNDGKVRPR